MYEEEGLQIAGPLFTCKIKSFACSFLLMAIVFIAKAESKCVIMHNPTSTILHNQVDLNRICQKFIHTIFSGVIIVSNMRTQIYRIVGHELQKFTAIAL